MEEEKEMFDQYGFIVENKKEYMEYQPINMKIQEKNKEMWSKFFSHPNKSKLELKSRKLKKMVRDGIHPEYRGKMWKLFLHVDASIAEHKGKFKQLLEDGENMEDPPIAFKQIEMDISRTFPGHELFESKEGREKLQRILMAFAVYQPEVGYCQGMNFIAGVLLLFIKDEEETFWALANIITKVLPNGYYSPSMIGSRVDQVVIDDLLKSRCSDVYKKFVQTKVDMSIVTTGWLVCLYFNSIPVETSLRVWDCFFHEGSKTLLRVAMGLVILYQNDILSSKNDCHSIFKILKNKPSVCFDCDKLFKIVFSKTGKFETKRIDKLRLNDKIVVEKERELEKQREMEIKNKKNTSELKMKNYKHLSQIW
eukprot:TRINITY_DN5903_c0_g1_i1.p1 TRINITY_DN5903_c0_g1~~TRINITY_DN5903_c0_g1_i1.p1  ORF type:complete len:366 (-),score=96.25 TRINITY_DN5903_c0_g1_i1:102-1199(-)